MNSLKITLNDEIRRFSFEKDENVDTFNSFKKTVEELFSLKNIENFEFYYLDEESDKIKISSNVELDHFLSTGTQQPKRLSLEEKQNNSDYQVESNAPVTESSSVPVDIPVVEEKEDIQFNSDVSSKPDRKNMTKQQRINFKAQRKQNRVAQKSAKQQARCTRRNQTSVVDKEHWNNMTKEERINFKAQRKQNRVAQKSVGQKQRFAKQQARIRAREERVEA